MFSCAHPPTCGLDLAGVNDVGPGFVCDLQAAKGDVVDGPDSRDAAVAAVTTGESDVIVIVPEGFGDQLAGTIPAKVELISDQANTQAERDARRVRTALYSYNQELATMRLVARGVSPMALRPLNVDEVDVSTPSGRSAILLGMMSYFFVFALLMGGRWVWIRRRHRRLSAA